METTSSPSSLDDNLAERSHKDKCKNCKANHEYITVSNGSLVFKCVECNKNYKKKFDEDLAKRSENTQKFCDRDINTFFLIL